MKFLHLTLPLLSSLAVAQLVADVSQCPLLKCPQVKCPSSDTIAGCICTNLAEARCKARCPYYIPTKLQICSLPQTTATLVTTATLATPTLPILGFPTPELPIPDLPTPALPSSPVLSDTPLVPGCECEEMFCIQSYPESCHCAYNIKKTCWAKCGGPSPGLNTCPAVGSNPFDGPVKRAAQAEVKVPAVKPTVSILPIAVVTEVATSVVVAASAPTSIPTVVAPLASAKVSPIKKCKCEEVMCIQSFPAGCFCANAGKRACWKKCGGPKPAFQNCTTPLNPPIPSSAPTKVQICGGGRAGANLCPSGYTCINDPYKPGCGIECDGTGICVKEKLCGGFAGFKCDGVGQVCVDDPRDACSPATGGADCGGLCVWPPELRT